MIKEARLNSEASQKKYNIKADDLKLDDLKKTAQATLQINKA